MSTLELTLLYLLAAVLGVVACRLAKLPPMLGYLVVGVVIGPNALGLAQNSTGVSHLAEFGVVFLMFVIGLEFNLPKLRAMRRHVFGLGLLQVLLTVLVASAALLALAWAGAERGGASWHKSLRGGGLSIACRNPARRKWGHLRHRAGPWLGYKEIIIVCDLL
jgi:CPA2 family monovalent cation:H+ antiporter-2